MYQPQNMKMSWTTYPMNPPVHAPQGFILSPRCGPPILHLPSKVYRVCSPVGPRMSQNTIIPTLIPVHARNQQGPPIFGLSPIVNGPPLSPIIQQNPRPALHHPISTRNAGRLEVKSTNDTRVVASSIKEDHPVKAHVRQPSPVVMEDKASNSSCRKRSASPTEFDRKLKRQRETSKSPNPECDNHVQTSFFTPEKPKEKPDKELTRDNSKIGKKLSDSITWLCNRHKQSDEWMLRKMKLRDVLHSILKSLHPQCGLYMVGSSMTGLACTSSDLDLCLVLCQSEINQQTEAIVYLREVLNAFRHCNFIQKPQLIYAKVPILKFTDRVSGVEVDLNVNNVVGIRNTQLINNYSRCDCRVQLLCIIIKLWAKAQNINDPFNRTLSSYSIILMVLHYLQVGCEPPVLPCLHTLMPNHFKNTSDIRSLPLKLDLPQLVVKNHQSVGELLLGFFYYYGYVFNFEKNVISVRTGGTVAKQVAMNCRSPKNKPSQWNFICIEEPFDRTNTARSVFDELAFNRIRNAFGCSLDTLRKTQDLDSILCVELKS